MITEYSDQTEHAPYFFFTFCISLYWQLSILILYKLVNIGNHMQNGRFHIQKIIKSNHI